MTRENTYHENISDVHLLHRQLVRLTEQNSYDLRTDEKLTGCVTVKIRYPDFETVSRQETIDYTSLDDQLIAKVKDLFTKLYRKGQPVRLLGIRFGQLIPFTMQMNLFNNNEEKLNLYKAVDNIKDRFGGKSILKAVTVKNKQEKSE